MCDFKVPTTLEFLWACVEAHRTVLGKPNNQNSFTTYAMLGSIINLKRMNAPGNALEKFFSLSKSPAWNHQTTKLHAEEATV